MLLAIDTSAGTSVAVVDRDAGVIAERSSPDTRTHAESIGTLIADCLTAAEVDIASLSAVAAGMGPGPFTGLRVGIAAAQAFAMGAARPVVHVVSHDAVAFAADRPAGRGPLLVVTDARRREVYWSLYSGTDAAGLPIRAGGPALARPEELVSSVHATGIGDFDRIDAAEVSAGSLGMLAERMFELGRPFAGPAALYLRAPDVTLSVGRKRVS